MCLGKRNRQTLPEHNQPVTLGDGTNIDVKAAAV